MTVRINLLIVCLCLMLGPRAFADGTNLILSQPETISAALQNGLLQIQAQLRDTQLAIEDSRRQTTAESRRDAEAMTARIQTLEKAIADQRAGEMEAAQKTQQMTLFMAGAFGLAALGIMLLMVYFQWRAFSQLAEISARVPRALPVAEMVGELSAPARAAVESSNVRLLGVVEQLEKRIKEMEQAARPTLAENSPSTTPAHKNGNGASSPADDREECVANLLTEGQTLLNSNEPEKALECFEVALALQPDHAETLIKKGGALEKLGRMDEAIACYDRAIAADGSMTIAYLHKGGLFNRMARYDDALQCYEKALLVQDKKPADEKVAA